MEYAFYSYFLWASELGIDSEEYFDSLTAGIFSLEISKISAATKAYATRMRCPPHKARCDPTRSTGLHINTTKQTTMMEGPENTAALS